jgi:hypothetical protein
MRRGREDAAVTYEHTYRREPAEYRARLNEAIAVAQGGPEIFFNERFISALEKRGMLVAMRKHPKTADDWFPEGGPLLAPKAREGAFAWPEGAVVVWSWAWHR